MDGNVTEKGKLNQDFNSSFEVLRYVSDFVEIEGGVRGKR